MTYSVSTVTAGIHPFYGVPEGQDALVLQNVLVAEQRTILHIAQDDMRLAKMAEMLAFFAPDVPVLQFPAWDTVPYDRISPNTEIMAQRLGCLAALYRQQSPAIVLTTVAAVLQRVPPREMFADVSLTFQKGMAYDLNTVIEKLQTWGYTRSEQVMEWGEMALRGGIFDIFPPGADDPIRLDFFGDEIDTMRSFDPMSQRTKNDLDSISVQPVSEVILTPDAISRFRTGYRETFGMAGGGKDPIYEAVSNGRRYAGVEQWLPLFYEGMDSFFAYLPENVLVFADRPLQSSVTARHDQIYEYFDARRTFASAQSDTLGDVYHPLPPENLYLSPEDWARALLHYPVLEFSPFEAPDVAKNALDAKATQSIDFAEVRNAKDADIYEALRQDVVAHYKAKRKVVFCAYSTESITRLKAQLNERGLVIMHTLDAGGLTKLKPKNLGFAVLSLERGFVNRDLAVITEHDLLGDKFARPKRRKRRADKFIADASSLLAGDLVVHMEHGIGRYEGLETLDISGAAHDCLKLIYDGGDKLFVPVENIDVLSRYGNENAGAILDKLGGPSWQARKAKLKQRIRDMAEGLIQLAAKRSLQKGPGMHVPEGVYDEFAARFPYAETEDQLKAIHDTLSDLSAEKPMDRLVCGDVGFGKTEVALRAAFVAAMSGHQVALVVPTTLLARQHYETFRKRFEGLPIRLGHLSRLASSKDAKATKEGLKDGTVDIVIGTHALLAKTINIKNLGLLIIDEEQHFGVAHKERLKNLKSNVHVLTLTATPIPRTLQLSLTGVKELSIIATPPVDRLAVRTFVLPFDPVLIREAILREKYRGGQIFYVCPRLKDMDSLTQRIERLIPEVKIVTAHGQMAAKELENRMEAFANGEYDILMATNIIESGIDMPTVNTILIHRSDLLGLAQLYQLRGRVGRGKVRGYCYMTLPPNQPLSKTADQRLNVMLTLDNLGAGFNLASHDLDIRGAGNLLGDEQSGHIKEVGIELYQHMLEEAVAAAKAGEGIDDDYEEHWSPQINLGVSILIPERYITDLSLRLKMYKRIAGLETIEDVQDIRIELIDRFGNLPEEIENLLQVIHIKVLCRQANIQKIDAGPKAAVVSFKGASFPNPEGLIQFISKKAGLVKVKADHRLVYMRAFPKAKERMDGVRAFVAELAKIAQK